MAETSGSLDHLESLSITNVTQSAILHACLALSPVGIKLPGSGTHRIEQFCREILTAVQQNAKLSKKKRKNQLAETSLVPQVEILNFYEGAISASNFALVICDHLFQHVGPGFNDTVTIVQEICWKIYSECQKFGLTFPKWLTGNSTYSLWLVFCSSLASMSEKLEPNLVEEILLRVYLLCSYSWSENTSSPIPSEPINFPEFLECLTNHFSALDLHPNVVTEIVLDLKDEIVHGVLRKGYLEKKGHKAPTIKRRWFVLMRNVLIYYQSRDKLVEKGRIVLNPYTTPELLSDKPDRRYRFLVVCGKSKKEYKLYADDNRSRNEWILDIQKAIQLENALQQKNEDDFSQSLGHFYRLRYGTSDPVLLRADSLLQRSMISFPVQIRDKLKYTSSSYQKSPLSPSSLRFSSMGGGACTPYSIGVGTKSGSFDSPSSYTSEELYEEMDSKRKDTIQLELDDDEGSDENGYTFMYKGKVPENKNLLLSGIVDACNVIEDKPEKNDNDRILPFTDSSSKNVSDGSNQHTLEDDDTLNYELVDMEVPQNNHSLFIKLKELDLQTIPEKSTNRELSEQDMPPLPPPRPLETMSSSKSFDDILDDVCRVQHSPTLHMCNTRPPSAMYSPRSPSSPHHGSLRLSMSSPVPPPRPAETFTNSSTTYLKNTFKTCASIREFDLPNECNEDTELNSPLTPPPIPVRDHAVLSSQRSTSSIGSPSRIRHPPYSNEQKESEHELYYVIPNSTPSAR